MNSTSVTDLKAFRNDCLDKEENDEVVPMSITDWKSDEHST